VQFGFTKIKGTKINLHANSPPFMAAKLKGFTGCRIICVYVCMHCKLILQVELLMS